MYRPVTTEGSVARQGQSDILRSYRPFRHEATAGLILHTDLMFFAQLNMYVVCVTEAHVRTITSVRSGWTHSGQPICEDHAVAGTDWP
jgi:hypothetical protein